MKRAGAALSAGLRAPWTRLRLVLVLWLVRLVPVVLAFALPLYERAREASANHPDSGLLLDAPADRSGFAYAWTSDFFRGPGADAPERLFWLVVVAWLLVTVAAGGITARLLPGRPRQAPFLAECGRYAGRFLRLGAVALLAFYAVDLLFNTFLAERHREAALLHHTQDFSLRKAWTRGLPFLALVYLIGLVHAYARIDLVARDRRSALLSFGRGLGLLAARLPSLLVVELGMLAAAGAALLVAKAAAVAVPLGPGSSWTAVVLLAVFAALASLLRTGVEVGAMEARCRLLAPAPETAPPSQDDTLGPWLVGEEEAPPSAE